MTKASYVMPFKILMRQLELAEQLGDEPIELTRDKFLSLMRHLLIYVPCDEDWYTKTYPDVAQAIASGKIKSAKEDFSTDGYFEGRKPGPIDVDEVFYLETYPDVAEGIEFGDIVSAQSHFDEFGYAEGRLPFDVSG
jgi:hypothetical protein